MTIVKEYYEKSVAAKTRENPDAKPAVIGNVCILRFEDNRQLKVQDLALLFNEAAKDFPSHIQARTIDIQADHIGVELRQPLAGYKKLPSRTIGG